MTFEPLTPERRRQQTRDYLLRAAAQVFSERGFHGATLDEVAAVAGFTKGAVYSNFKNKDDLFLALLESRYEEEMGALPSTLEGSTGAPEAHLSEFVDLIRDQLDDARNPWRVLYQEFCVYAMRNPEAQAKLAEFERAEVESIAEIIEAERKRHGLDGNESAQQAARIVVSLIRGLVTMRLIDAKSVDRSLLEASMAFIARAMS